ncbi:hypothetical protein Tco_1320437 [Tanacetum coccineum]
MTSKAQQIELDNALVAPENCRVIGKCNMRINPGMKSKEPTYQVAMDALVLTTCYPAFLIIAEVPVIYMHQFWATVTKHKSSYRSNIDNKKFSVNVEVFRDILNICPKVPSKAFDEPPTEEETLSFIYELGHTREIKYITNAIVDHLHKPWRTFAAIINKCLCGKEDLAFQIDNIDSKKQDKIFYPRFTKIIIHHFLKKDKSISMRNRMFMHTARDDSLLGAEPLISRKSQKKSDLAILFEKSPSKKKFAKANKFGDGTDFESGVPDEQHLNTTGADEGTGIIPRVPDVPKYDYESDKESWSNSGEEDEDDENDFEDKSDDGDDDDGNDSNDDDDDDNQEGDDTNDDDEETDSDRTDSDIIKTHVLNQSNTEYYEEEEEKINDEETMDDEEDDEVTKELYKDVNVNLGNEDTEMTNADQGGSEQHNKADEPVQSSFVSSDFTSKLLNLENPSPADNEITSLMETSNRHATTILEITSGFTTTIQIVMQRQFLKSHLFNDRVTNLEKDLSEIKQVDQYAQALSSIPTIVDRYIDNKVGEAINKAIQAHNLDCRQEAQDEKNEYIGLVDTSMRTIIKEEVTTQLPQILPQAVYDFATPVIEKNVAESLEAAVLKRSSSQPQSTYEAAAALFEFELIKMLIDKMEKNKSYDKTAYKRELYEALVKSYETDKDLFDSYGEVFTLKRSIDDKDKDQDPFAGSDQGTKRRKSRKEAELSKDSRSKEKKSSSTSKDTSQSQHKSSGKSSYTEEPSHNVEDLGMQQDQEFAMRDNDEQPANKEVSKDDWFKKPERPPTPDSDWNKRHHVDFRPPQTWIN